MLRTTSLAEFIQFPEDQSALRRTVREAGRPISPTRLLQDRASREAEAEAEADIEAAAAAIKEGPPQ